MSFLDTPIKPPVTAALAGKVGKGEIFVNVRDYGVALDGTPTGTALTNAISAANLLGLPLRLPQGRYSFDQVNLPNNTTIEGSGPDTVIVQGVAAQPTFMALGSTAALGALTEDLVVGATTINVTQSWGLVAGDIIMVTDNYSYAATDAAYKSGEQFRVAASTGTTITLDSPVRGSFSNAAGSYTVANGATLTKLNMVKNVTLRNMAFEGHPAGTVQMLKFQNVENLELTGLSTTTAQAGFCLIDRCRNVSASDFLLQGLVDNWASGYPGYGFIIRHACHNVTISNGISTMSRHAITTIGGPYGIPRNLVFGPNIISDDTSSTAGIDTHSAGEGVLIHGNVITNSLNGISVRARNVVVRGNRVNKTTSSGIMVNENGQDVIIDANTLSNNAALGIRVGAGGSTHNNVDVRNNVLLDTGGDALSASAGQTDLRVTGNEIRRGNAYGINVDASCTDVLIARNDVSDVALTSTKPAINVTGTQVDGVFDIIGNTVKQKAAKANRAVYTTRTQGRMIGNRAFGTYLSTGSEFNAGAGVTAADNVLYA